METLKNATAAAKTSTQQFVDIEEIRDGVMILKNNGLRTVLLVSSLNFDLKSVEEQDAIIFQYQNFINSLDFPLQTIIYSRRFNITPYLDQLRQFEVQQNNELLRLQISEYHNFIKNLTEVSNIMSKDFYVVIPFSPTENQETGFFHKLSTVFNPKQVVKERLEVFETYRSQLLQRVEHVSYGLSATGVTVKMLTTEETIELLYNTYNPSLFTTVLTSHLSSIDIGK
ncbi:MAG: hypothetical protein WCG84_04450 [Candidatus Moraniibacteriota bacterium]